MAKKTKINDTKWLLLLYQMPAKSESERVRIWRAQQKMGAISVKNSVSALPDTEFFRKSIIDLADQIESCGGEAIVTKGHFLFGLKPESLAQSYNLQMDTQFKKLAKEIQETVKSIASTPSASELMRWDHKRTKFASQLNDLSQRAITTADGEDQCRKFLVEFDKKLKSPQQKSLESAKKFVVPKNAVWVTRKDPYIDRLASAWLIKRHIDKNAEILFVDIDKYTHKPQHVRFDVFNGEFAHVGDLCTFENLVQHFKIKSSAINALAQVVHDLDIQDGKFDRAETPGIRMALEGIIHGYKDDHERLEAAMSLLDSLVLSLKK